VSLYLCQDAPLAGRASTVVDLAHGEARILRVGDVSGARIAELLGGSRGD
jgi:tRNA A37 threonylcarbamoyladenosine synthetase subunit TsaC/SUA5/YrdC